MKVRAVLPDKKWAERGIEIMFESQEEVDELYADLNNHWYGDKESHPILEALQKLHFQKSNPGVDLAP